MDRKTLVTLAAVLLAIGCAFAGAITVLALARPPQPLRLGTIQWLDEVGATVDSIDRAARITDGKHTAFARGEYYIVHARIIAPFGVRPHWSDTDVEVRTFSGTGGSMRDRRFTVDEAAQRVLDAKTGRPGPNHVVLGAEQHEDLVFDLPRNVEQPGLLFLPANDPVQLLEILFLQVWQPHRFNLRYD